MRRLLGLCKRGCLRAFGSVLRDEETAEYLGRAFIVVWRGRILLVGFDGPVPVRAVFLKQREIDYRRQTLGFRKAERPDFPRAGTAGREI